MTQNTVNRYVQVAALAGKLKKERDKLRNRIVSAFANGETCPTNGPFLLKCIPEERQGVSWKDIAEELARRTKSRRLLERLVAKAPKTPVPTLIVVPNPEWEEGRR